MIKAPVALPGMSLSGSFSSAIKLCLLLSNLKSVGSGGLNSSLVDLNDGQNALPAISAQSWFVLICVIASRPLG